MSLGNFTHFTFPFCELPPLACNISMRLCEYSNIAIDEQTANPPAVHHNADRTACKAQAARREMPANRAWLRPRPRRAYP
jgi:hypothetical protein